MNEKLKHEFEIIIHAVHAMNPTANGWGCIETRSGGGSTLESTKPLRNALPKLFDTFNIKSILDIPCGDFHWMKEVNLTGIEYVGADIAEVFVNDNRLNYPQHEFLHLDITEDPLPKKDLVIVRDCFIHLSYENIKKSLENIKNSGSTYLLTSSRRNLIENKDILDSDFRQINMEINPFYLNPIYCIDEDTSEPYRSMILIKIDDLK
jgi:SAM-dependent methyltransferase